MNEKNSLLDQVNVPEVLRVLGCCTCNLTIGVGALCGILVMQKSMDVATAIAITFLPTSLILSCCVGWCVLKEPVSQNDHGIV